MWTLSLIAAGSIKSYVYPVGIIEYIFEDWLTKESTALCIWFNMFDDDKALNEKTSSTESENT